MVELEAGRAALAGLAGGAVMVVLLYGAIAMMPGVMRMNMMALLGGMLGLVGVSGFAVGLMIHAMMSAGFGIAHIAVFSALDFDEVTVGAAVVLGLVHAMVSGTMLVMMPVVHPLVQSGRMEAPGPFGWSLGPMNAVGFVMLHVIFAVVVSVAY